MKEQAPASSQAIALRLAAMLFWRRLEVYILCQHRSGEIAEAQMGAANFYRRRAAPRFLDLPEIKCLAVAALDNKAYSGEMIPDLIHLLLAYDMWMQFNENLFSCPQIT